MRRHWVGSVSSPRVGCASASGRRSLSWFQDVWGRRASPSPSTASNRPSKKDYPGIIRQRGFIAHPNREQQALIAVVALKLLELRVCQLLGQANTNAETIRKVVDRIFVPLGITTVLSRVNPQELWGFGQRDWDSLWREGIPHPALPLKPSVKESSGNREDPVVEHLREGGEGSLFRGTTVTASSEIGHTDGELVEYRPLYRVGVDVSGIASFIKDYFHVASEIFPLHMQLFPEEVEVIVVRRIPGQNIQSVRPSVGEKAVENPTYLEHKVKVIPKDQDWEWLYQRLVETGCFEPSDM